ncbi:transposase [Candidatus Pacearchaeota archaeon]|nr:transposase [Candidatus Pacearchaeota archaeon]
MKKLNKRKIKWIVKESERRELGFYTIGKQQKITARHARRVAKKYRKCKDPILLKCGRKPRPITNEERNIVIQAYKEIITGATMIEQYLDEKGIHINHNRIHKILLEAKLAREEQKKKHRRSWVRYERKHSLSLVHADWFEHKRRQGIIFIDDASRFITGYGEFDNANMDNTIKVFKKSLKWGIPKLTHTDHGTQFVSVEAEGKKFNASRFTESVKEAGSKHILARIKHPQANGKAERVIGTIKRLWNVIGSLDKAIEHYNYKRPHRSLTNGKLRTPYQAFLDKKRK